MPETAFETCVLHDMTIAFLPSFLCFALDCPGYSVYAGYRRCWLCTVTALSARTHMRCMALDDMQAANPSGCR